MSFFSTFWNNFGDGFKTAREKISEGWSMIQQGEVLPGVGKIGAGLLSGAANIVTFGGINALRNSMTQAGDSVEDWGTENGDTEPVEPGTPEISDTPSISEETPASPGESPEQTSPLPAAPVFDEGYTSLVTLGSYLDTATKPQLEMFYHAMTGVRPGVENKDIPTALNTISMIYSDNSNDENLDKLRSALKIWTKGSANEYIAMPADTHNNTNICVLDNVRANTPGAILKSEWDEINGNPTKQNEKIQAVTPETSFDLSLASNLGEYTEYANNNDLHKLFESLTGKDFESEETIDGVPEYLERAREYYNSLNQDSYVDSETWSQAEFDIAVGMRQWLVDSGVDRLQYVGLGDNKLPAIPDSVRNLIPGAVSNLESGGYSEEVANDINTKFGEAVSEVTIKDYIASADLDKLNLFMLTAAGMGDKLPEGVITAVGNYNENPTDANQKAFADSLTKWVTDAGVADAKMLVYLDEYLMIPDSTRKQIPGAITNLETSVIMDSAECMLKQASEVQPENTVQTSEPTASQDSVLTQAFNSIAGPIAGVAMGFGMASTDTDFDAPSEDSEDITDEEVPEI